LDLIFRGDLKRENPAPPEALKYCLDVGGENPYGEPLFRLCLAEDRIMQAAGEWNQWDEDAPVEERGGLGIALVQQMLAQRQDIIYAARKKGFTEDEIKKITKDISGMIEEIIQECLARQPKSVFVGMAEVEVYPSEGWILEKWKPAEAWGPEEEWNRYRFQGVAALGSYPHFGMYELFAGPSPYLPTEEEISSAIRMHFQELDSRPTSPQQLVLQMMNARAERNKKKRAARLADIQAAASDGPGSLHNRLSLGAGRVMNELAKKAGIKEHVGN
jgi:hypothetical protein